MGESQFFPHQLFPHLKTHRVKPSLVPRLYPHTQTNCNVKRDGVWQVWQPDGRPRLPEAVSGRWCLPDAVWQRAVWQVASSRRCLADSHLTDAVWLTRRLADSHLSDAVWQMLSGRRQTPSGRRCLAEGRLADSRPRLAEGCLADSV